MRSFESAIKQGYGSVDPELLKNSSQIAYLKARYTEKYILEKIASGGNKAPLKQLLNDLQPFFKRMYGNWLNSEKILVSRNSLMVRKWEQVQKTKHILPNLEYIPSRSANPRQSHKILYGIIKPIDDPFWSTYMPANGYNCKCSVRPTQRKATDNTPSLDISDEFKQNVGQSRKIFTNDHPYYKNAPREFLQNIIQASEALLTNYIATKIGQE